MRVFPDLPTLSAPTKIRLGFAVITGLYAVLTSTVVATLPWLFLVVSLDLTATAIGAIPGLSPTRVRRMTLTFIALSAAAAGAAFGVRGVPTAPLVLIAAYHAGLRFQRFGYLLACVLAFAAAFVSTLLVQTAREPTLKPIFAWAIAALALGVLGAWSHRLSAENDDGGDSPEVVEAIALMQRLRELSDEMDTGFDAPALASATLQSLRHAVPSDRSVVFTGSSATTLAPVALRGATRVPWLGRSGGSTLLEAAASHPGPLIQTWSDATGDRCVLSVPLVARSGEAIGLLVADRVASDPFTAEELGAAWLVARRTAPALGAALLFADLRARASLEERQRLARDIHDGIAQTIAALGFELDAVRLQAAKTNNPLAESLNDLRTSLQTTLLDVRLHISDLNMSQRPETGLGAIIGAAVQNFGAVTGVKTTVSVREGLLRLPSHVELSVYRLAMDILADAQATGATSATLTLSVEAPGVDLCVSHDGASRLTTESFRHTPLRDEGATIAADRLPGRGVRVCLALGTVEPPRVAPQASVADNGGPDGFNAAEMGDHGPSVSFQQEASS